MELDHIKHRVEQDPAAFIAECDAAYHEKLKKAADHIKDRAEECPIILISGPSGSGKTTSAKLIERYLDRMGLETHAIAMDNYFLSLTDEEKEQMRQNKLDLESPARIDAALLCEHLEALRCGREISLPRYHFPTGTRHQSGETLRRKKGELIVFEGIHSLNPDIFGDTDSFTSRIYVSVRTRVTLPNGGVLHPSKIRLARRMVRDNRTRGRSFEKTAEAFASVERGEQNFIMPFKHRAQVDIDTFIPYEPCVYKSFLPEQIDSREEWVDELFALLHALPTLDAGAVPSDSLIREYIGGGIAE